MELLRQQNAQFYWYSGPWQSMGNCGVLAPPIGPPQRLQSTSPVVYGCSTGQAPSNIAWGSPIPASIRGIAKLRHTHNTATIPAFPRFAVEERWIRNVGGTVAWTPHVMLNPMPRFNPDPWRMPPKQFAPPPMAPPWFVLPYKVPDPYSPPPPADPAPPYRPPPDLKVEFNPIPVSPTVSVTHSPPRRKPPGPPEKEKKFAGAGDGLQEFFRVISRGKEALTEFDDLLDVFVKALPQKLRNELEKDNKGKKYKWQFERTTPQEKLALIYDNFHLVNWDKFLDEFVNNYIEDKIVGKSIDLADRATHKRGGSSTSGGRVQLPRF